MSGQMAFLGIRGRPEELYSESVTLASRARLHPSSSSSYQLRVSLVNINFSDLFRFVHQKDSTAFYSCSSLQLLLSLQLLVPVCGTLFSFSYHLSRQGTLYAPAQLAQVVHSLRRFSASSCTYGCGFLHRFSSRVAVPSASVIAPGQDMVQPALAAGSYCTWIIYGWFIHAN